MTEETGPHPWVITAEIPNLHGECKTQFGERSCLMEPAIIVMM
jgi:hypothetical protein